MNDHERPFRRNSCVTGSQSLRREEEWRNGAGQGRFRRSHQLSNKIKRVSTVQNESLQWSCKSPNYMRNSSHRDAIYLQLQKDFFQMMSNLLRYWAKKELQHKPADSLCSPGVSGSSCRSQLQKQCAAAGCLDGAGTSTQLPARRTTVNQPVDLSKH